MSWMMMEAVMYGMTPSAKMAALPNAPPEKDVQQTQKSVAVELAGKRRPLAQGVGVDTRNHHETTQAVDQQQPDRVDHTFAQLLDLVDILERFNQFLVGRQKSDYH